MLVKPSDRFSVTVGAQLQDIDTDASSIVDARPGQPRAPEPHSGAVQLPVGVQRHEVPGLQRHARLGPRSARLQSITSYGTFETDFQTDLAIATNLTGGPPLASLVTPLFGNAQSRPLSAVLPQTTSTDKFTQELRLVSAKSNPSTGWWAAYYTNEDSAIKQKISPSKPGTDNVATGIPTLADVSLDSTYEEFAGFANATWHVTPRLDLSLGGRLSHNKQVASQRSDGPLAGGPAQFDDVKSSESPFTFSFAPRFEVGRSASIYGRVATGFRPGGPNVLPPAAPPSVPRTYDSDRLTSYEVGLKAGGRPADKFSLDLAGYYLDWEDIQLFLIVNNFGINGNGGTAASKGFELAASVFPTSGLVLSLNAAYTDAKLTQDTIGERRREGRRSAALRSELELRAQCRLRMDGEGPDAGLRRRQPGLHRRPARRLRQPRGRREHPPGGQLRDPESPCGRLPRPVVRRALWKEPDQRPRRHEHRHRRPPSRWCARTGLTRPRTIGLSIGTRLWGS